MLDVNQLPHLVRLLEDESPKVRAKIVEKLRAYGPGLEPELLRQGLELAPELRRVLSDGLPRMPVAEFLNRWMACLELASAEEQIEAGFALIAEHQEGRGNGARVAPMLDALAAEFRATGLAPDALELGRWLFTVHGLRGANEDYYNPSNSNLSYVLEKRRGIPISLACVFILVGKRLGIAVHGCNVPHHFLVRALVAGVEYIFDPFSGGKLVSPAQLEDLRRIAPPQFLETLETPATARSILLRVLSNLIVAYQQAGEEKHTAFFQKILRATRQQAAPPA